MKVGEVVRFLFVFNFLMYMEYLVVMVMFERDKDGFLFGFLRMFVMKNCYWNYYIFFIYFLGLNVVFF